LPAPPIDRRAVGFDLFLLKSHNLFEAKEKSKFSHRDAQPLQQPVGSITKIPKQARCPTPAGCIQKE